MKQEQQQVSSTCEQCGQSFEHGIRTPRRYCSQSCKYAARVVRVPAEMACATCGKAFVRKAKSRTRFCSLKCACAKRNTSVRRDCLQCRQSFVRSPSRVSDYCSRSCREEHLRLPLEDDFWRYVEKGGECWLWTGWRGSFGYGQFARRDAGTLSVRLAHRVSYEMAYGTIPAGKNVRHLCDEPACVRPEHLTLGTQRQNMSDMVERGRQAKGERHGAAKLSEEDVRAIRASPSTGAQLAKRYGVTEATISHIRVGKHWKHVV